MVLSHTRRPYQHTTKTLDGVVKVIRSDDQDAENRNFQFDIAGSLTNEYVLAHPHYEVNGHGGYIPYNANGAIVGISWSI